MSMLRTVLPAIACAALPAAADAPAFPPSTLVLFVADWCAPCHGEVARLEEIAAAARPWAVLVVDGGTPARPGRLVRRVAEGRRWVPDAGTALRLRRELMSDVAGLPYAVAFDASSRPCADSRRGMDGPRARALVASCRAP